MAYGLTRPMTSRDPKGAVTVSVRQYGRLSWRQLGFLLTKVRYTHLL